MVQGLPLLRGCVYLVVSGLKQTTTNIEMVKFNTNQYIFKQFFLNCSLLIKWGNNLGPTFSVNEGHFFTIECLGNSVFGGDVFSWYKIIDNNEAIAGGVYYIAVY